MVDIKQDKETPNLVLYYVRTECYGIFGLRIFLLPCRIKFRFLEAKAIIHTETAITGPEKIVLFLSKHNKIIVKLLT